MSKIDYIDGTVQDWETVADGVEKIVLRSKPGENRVLLKIAAGKSYPKQHIQFLMRFLLCTGSM